MKNIVENQGIKTDKPLPMSYEALKAERDALAQRVEMLAQNLGNAIWGEQEALQRVNALAVENQSLKAAGNKMFLSAISLMEDPELKIDHSRDIKDWERNENPATDAALAAIEARAKVEAIELLIGRKKRELADMHPDTHAFGMTSALIRNQIRCLESFATELREAK
ncbi:hypothetical protein [Serratia marcescens]|uniref:hypothetical protein n=1 Tax=Serratia marcescens TaxID=615 RepID=UPI003FA7777F